MSFAILHMQKLKQPAIKGIQFHNQREKESHTNGDIDPEKLHLNYDLVNGDDNVDYNKLVQARIDEGVTTGKTIRKDAVKLAGFLVTSGKEFFDRLDPKEERRFFETSYEFFTKKYGRENIVYSMVHKDEKTPHMHVGFVPITEDGRLSAKDFFGKKQQLRELQDDFHKHVKEKGFDLERGVSSDKKHIETARFKALTAQEQLKELETEFKDGLGKLTILERDIKERKIILEGQLKTAEMQSNMIKKGEFEFEQVKEKLTRLQAPLEKIESIKGKVALGNVLVKKSEFESLKKMAHKATLVDDLQKESNALKRENNDLKRHNVSQSEQFADLQFENRTLKKEVNKFKSLYNYSIKVFQKLNVWDRIKEKFEEHEKSFEKKPQKKLEKEMDFER